MPSLPTIEPKQNDQDLRLLNSARSGDLRAVRALIALGVNIDEADAKGNTALIYASMAGHLGIVHRLLDAGANPALLTDDGWDAYHVAMYFGDFRGVIQKPYDMIMKAMIDEGYDPRNSSRQLRDSPNSKESSRT